MIFNKVKLEDYPKIAQEILATFPTFKKIILHGPMGAGKTTFVKSFIQALGSQDKGSSPTFGLVNEYELPENEVVFHFDCYRIEQEEEILEIGWEDYMESSSYCLIEWPEKVASYLPDKLLMITIDIEEGYRNFEVKKLE